MNKRMFFLPLITTAFLLCNPKIKLESPVLGMADNTFITADKIEYMRKFCGKLLSIILGELMSNNQRKGKYNLLGKNCSIEDLARIEKELSNAINDDKTLKIRAALEELLTRAKADFIVQSSEFIESGRGAKNIMTILIQEFCQKSNRQDSFLLDWARTKEGQESTTFERHIRSFNDYYHFLSDLVNFLRVLSHSCPKAETQFKDRVAKWGAVKEILPVVFKKAHIKGEHINEIEFLKYLKERYLDSLTLSEITPQIIVPLLAEYIKHTT
jgi:hypothetical protein